MEEQKAISAVDLFKHDQVLYNILMYRIEKSIMKHRGTEEFLNKTILPKEYGNNTKNRNTSEIIRNNGDETSV